MEEILKNKLIGITDIKKRAEIAREFEKENNLEDGEFDYLVFNINMEI